MDADQSGPDQVVFYLSFLYHLWVTICHLPFYGVLVEYQKVYPDPGGEKVFK